MSTFLDGLGKTETLRYLIDFTDSKCLERGVPRVWKEE